MLECLEEVVAATDDQIAFAVESIDDLPDALRESEVDVDAVLAIAEGREGLLLVPDQIKEVLGEEVPTLLGDTPLGGEHTVPIEDQMPEVASHYTETFFTREIDPLSFLSAAVAHTHVLGLRHLAA